MNLIKHIITILLIALGVTGTLQLRAQVMGPLNNLRYLYMPVDSFPVPLVEEPVASTLRIMTDEAVSRDVTDYFRFNGRQIIRLRRLPEAESITNLHITYRVYQGSWSRPYRLLDTTLILPKWMPGINDVFYQPGGTLTPITRNAMSYRGAFTRGLSIGNNQDLALNSAFNLQLAGDLGDNIRIIGALSDNAIPIQPEGNSQQLQEFDKVFIELSNKNSTLTIGDFELNRPPGYFLNYFKKLQGVQLANETQLPNGHKVKSSGGVAITKGKFHRYSLPIQEGNQGPYRLPGAEGEAFVVILAGTERVYFDGALLIRGYDKDYIIDYNAGEIVFMPGRLITKDSRVVLEYEYSNQQYLRSFYNLNTRYEMNKWTFGLNAYNEQDGKNSALGRALTPEEKQTLALVGDSISNTLVNSIREIEPGNTAIIVSYSLVDTIVEGVNYQVLSFPWRPETVRYSADFTDVGMGNGHYIRSNMGINGRVYQWVAPNPLTGKPNGQYNPLVRLTAPNRKQMFTLSSTWQADSNTVFSVEGALSGFDQNRFSDLDDENNQGIGLLVHGHRKNMNIYQKWKWTSDAGMRYERIDKTFSVINPYRGTEFSRDWNLTDIAPENQHLGLLYFNQRLGDKVRLDYSLTGIYQKVNFKGLKQDAVFNIKLGNLQWSSSASLLKSETMREEASFFRPNMSLVQSMPKWGGMKLGLSYQSEINRRSAMDTDTLLPASFSFRIMRAFVQNTVSNKLSTEVYTQRRTDFAPVRDELLRANYAMEYGVKANWNQSEGSILNLTTTVRTFNLVPGRPKGNFESKNTYLGQLDYLFSAIKNRLSGNTLFEVSSGQEQKTEFNFIAVQPGQGQYVWIDFNGDSLQQINEFTTEGFPEQKNFTRVNIISNQFTRTLNTAFNQSIRWDGRISQDKNLSAFLNKFSTLSTVSFNRKIAENARVGFWNPFYTSIPDSSLVSYISNLRHSFFFNRGDAKYEIQLTGVSNESKSILVTGYEKRAFNEMTAITRVNFGANMSANVALFVRDKFSDSESDAFSINDYKIANYEIRPECNWLIGNKYRVAATYRYLNQRNRLAPLFETARTNDISLKLDFNQSAKSSLRLQTTLALINYNGQRNSAVEFAMLEGLKDGRNYLWSITYDHNLKNNVQLNFGYDGRKSDGINVVHTGRAQVKAFF